MAAISIADLKARFLTGDPPSQKDFIDLIDTLANSAASSLPADSVAPGSLQSNATTALLTNVGTGPAAWVAPTLPLFIPSYYQADTSGTPNQLAIAPSPAIGAYAAGQVFYISVANTNTGATQLAVSGLAAKNVYKNGSTPLAAGDIQAGQAIEVVYDGTQFQLLTAGSASAIAASLYDADSGGTNAMVITPSPAISGYAAGQIFFIKVAANCTGATTLDVNGFGTKAVQKAVSVDLANGDIVAGQIIAVAYDGTRFQMISPVLGTAASGALTLIAPVSILAAQTGNQSQTNYDASGSIPSGATVAIVLISAEVTGGASTGTTSLSLVAGAHGGQQNELYYQGVAVASAATDFEHVQVFIPISGARHFDYAVALVVPGGGVTWSLDLIGYI